MRSIATAAVGVILPMLSAVLLVVGLTALAAPAWIGLLVLVPVLVSIRTHHAGWQPIGVYAFTAAGILMFGTQQYGWMLLAGSILAVAAYLAAPLVLYRWAVRRGANDPMAIIFFASAYTAIDYLVSFQAWVPIGRIAATLASSPDWLGWTPWVGPFVIGYALTAANAAFAATVYHVVQRRPFAECMPAFGVALVILCAFAVGPAALTPAIERQDPPVRLAVVQGSVLKPQYEASIAGDVEASQLVLDRYLIPTAELFGEVDWVIWPETALWRYESAAAELTLLMRRPEARILGGFPVMTGNPSGGYARKNKVLFLDGGSRPSDSYAKVKLVPFAERLFERGTGAKLVATDRGPVATPICFEAAFARHMLDLLRLDPGAIVVVSNEAGFGRAVASHYMLKQAIVYSAAARKPLVRAGQSGVSAIVDERGQVISHTRLFEQTTLQGEIHFTYGRTMYVSAGDAHFVILLVLLGVVLVLGARRA